MKIVLSVDSTNSLDYIIPNIHRSYDWMSINTRSQNYKNVISLPHTVNHIIHLGWPFIRVLMIAIDILILVVGKIDVDSSFQFSFDQLCHSH